MSIDSNAFAILLLLTPFLGALLAPLIAPATGRAAGWILAIIPAGLFVALLTFARDISHGKISEFSLDWVPALDLKLSFRIDGLGLVFALMITGIGAAVLVYSGEYLKAHPRRGAFLALMLFFMGAMLGLVLADSLVALFAFWETTAVASFLLIGFDHERMEARRAATQALVVTGLGGLSLMAGGILLRVISGTWQISDLAASPTLHQAGAAYPWVLGFILVAAFTKSAQIPFHFWLPGAMEAPTPVSAYLHSAAMVQGGIYLLARMSPLLGGTPLWQGILEVIGGATLLWGALMALTQTDIKQMLARTTIAALGLMVLLLGLGGENMAIAVATFFVAHALYKASLFLIAGLLEHATGTRDITKLRGLRDELPITFIASGLAGLSMLGFPPFLGWFAKEALYGAAQPDMAWQMVLVVAVLVIGNALFGAIALRLIIRPFLGPRSHAPGTVRESGIALWLGPAALGLAGFSVVFALPFFALDLIAPMAQSITGPGLAPHLELGLDLFSVPVGLTVLSWLFAALVYLSLDQIRAALGMLAARGWGLDKVFDAALWSLVRLGAATTRLLQHGRLELYLVVLFGVLALVLILPIQQLAAWPPLPDISGISFYEWGGIALALVGLGLVVFARDRLFALVALGVQGLAVALIFLGLGAPDLALTQLVIEVLSVVVVALVMTRLQLSARDPRPLEDWLRDGVLALLCGGGVALLLLRVVALPFDTRLGDFFVHQAPAAAHGRNVVNVILVDFRGLDTLGEICVVMTAAIAALALLRRQHKPAPLDPTGPAAAPTEPAAGEGLAA